MPTKTVGTQPQNKKGKSSVATTSDKSQSTSTAHKQPRGSARKGK